MTGSSVQVRSWLLLICFVAVSGCDGRPWNDPYPLSQGQDNTLYSSFSQRPKHLDPARSYSSNEYAIIAQIYQPPLQYHYLRRPYALITDAATKLPEPYYLDRGLHRLKGRHAESDIAYSVYEIHIRPGIHYQPHPAFARDAEGRLRYHDLDGESLSSMGIRHLDDFSEAGSQELTAADFVYQIKRLASPDVLSPIAGLMGGYIDGFSGLARALQERRNQTDGFIDLRDFPLSGVRVIDRYTYSIRVKGRYPQLVYWLAMPFFAPVPYEVDFFYSQPGMRERNLSLDWYPVGTGPFMLSENDPNRRMVLERNPEFHGERYPDEGDPGDEERGLLVDAGRPLPLLDRVIFSLEKETIPYWNKFLQGYYDASGISSDSFDQAIRFSSSGEVGLSAALKDKGIRLNTSVQSSIFYMGFNMLDDVVGGDSKRARALRQAVSIAMNYEEFISIFANGRGVAAQGPIPPGIFGFHEGEIGVNPYVYDWNNGHPRRKDIGEALTLMRQAGYQKGIDTRTGKPLILHLDITATGPDDKARLEWYRKQLARLDIQLVVRNTDYNRFQEKMRTGNAQIFIWGWNADYPDPENFLFLLYGPNGKVRFHGENAANYDNPEFDERFERVKSMKNGPERQKVIDEMVGIVRRDAPWIWGMHPKNFSLYHAWYHNAKPNLMANNTLKYIRIDPVQRANLRAQWNQPVTWPLFFLMAVMVLLVLPAWLAHRRREYRTGQGRSITDVPESGH